jgi:adenylate cyclase
MREGGEGGGPAGSKLDVTRSHRAGARVSLLISLLAFSAASILGIAGAFRPLDHRLYDALHAFRGTGRPIPELAVVYVGDRDIARFREKLGRWPWRSRRPHQAALELLHAGGARQVGLDLLFTEESLDPEKSDRGLAEAMAVADGVVNACVFYTDPARKLHASRPSEAGRKALAASGGKFGVVPDDTGVTEAHDIELPIDALLEAAPRVGHVNAFVDPDGVIRRAPLLVRHGGNLYPSLALQLAVERLGASFDQVSFEPGVEIRIASPGRGTIRIPVDRRGAMRVNFEHRVSDYVAYQYSDIEQAGADAFRGKTVIVGVSATGSADVKVTPLDRECPGFLIHAAVFENIVTGRFLGSFDPDENPLGAGELLARLASGAATLGLGVLFTRLGRWAGAGAGVAVLAVPILLSGTLFLKGAAWFPPSALVFALLLAAAGNIAYRDLQDARERARVRRIYERYLSPQILETILREPSLLKLGGTRKEMTFFFSDIRGFTQFSESSEPEELTLALNEYFTAMTEIIFRHGGTLDKFVGDCIMVFFNDPLPQPDHALRAVRMAVEMKREMLKLQERWVKAGRKAFTAGMGIHTGFATVGNFGSEHFTNYTAIGNAVNLAARIEHESKGGQILVSSRTYHLVKDHALAQEVGLMAFKGVAEKVEVWEVTGLREESARA